MQAQAVGDYIDRVLEAAEVARSFAQLKLEN